MTFINKISSSILSIFINQVPRTTMIAYAADAHKQALMNIWKTAFPADSDAFVDFYFEKKYCKENTLLLFKDDEIASCLQMLPYKMTYYKERIDTAYISGAATVPAYQNQGLMQNLLAHSFVEMRKRGEAVTTLIPQTHTLIDFYKKMGYAPCFDYKIIPVNFEEYLISSDKMLFKEFEPADLHAAYSFYKRHFHRKNICIQKTPVDFSIMVQACQKFDGEVYVLKDRGEVMGLCFCFFDNGKIIVKDRITETKYYKEYFFSKLMQKYNNQPIFMHAFASHSHPSELLGMARIVNVKKILKIFAQTYPRAAFIIKINDEHVLRNNVTMVVSHGRIVETESQTVDFEVSIGELTQLLLGYQTKILGEKYAVFPQLHPYMSLMLE